MEWNRHRFTNNFSLYSIIIIAYLKQNSFKSQEYSNRNECTLFKKPTVVASVVTWLHTAVLIVHYCQCGHMTWYFSSTVANVVTWLKAYHALQTMWSHDSVLTIHYGQCLGLLMLCGQVSEVWVCPLLYGYSFQQILGGQRLHALVDFLRARLTTATVPTST